MTVSEVATALCVGRTIVRKWLQTGYLRGAKVARGVWEIREVDYARFCDQHRLHNGRVGFSKSHMTPEWMRSIAKHGGDAVVAKGTDMRELGARGGRKTAATHGREHFAAIGLKGRLARRSAADYRERGSRKSRKDLAEGGHRSGLVARGLPPRRPIHGGLPGLRREREAAGLTQRELSAISGVHEGTIINLELAMTNPAAHTISRLAIALGVGQDQLIAREGVS